MEAVEITSFEKLQEISNEDMVLGVRNGVPKLFFGSSFVKKGESVESAKKIGGYTADDLIKTDDEIDADKLGGKDANEYALNANGVGSSEDALMWSRPILWHSSNIMPDGQAPYQDNTKANYIILDGRYLDPKEFPELFSVIGYNFSETADPNKVDKFAVPNFVGRFPIGVGGDNNPELDNLVHKHNYPQSVGDLGGEDICHIELEGQLIRHSHTYSKESFSDEYVLKTSDSEGGGVYVKTKQSTQSNPQTSSEYGVQLPDGSFGTLPFSILNPCIGMVWIMRLKPR